MKLEVDGLETISRLWCHGSFWSLLSSKANVWTGPNLVVPITTGILRNFVHRGRHSVHTHTSLSIDQTSNHDSAANICLSEWPNFSGSLVLPHRRSSRKNQPYCLPGGAVYLSTHMHQHLLCLLWLYLLLYFVYYYIHLIVIFISPHCVSDSTCSLLHSPSADPSKFDATSILGFSSSTIAEQLTRIETVRCLVFRYWFFSTCCESDDQDLIRNKWSLIFQELFLKLVPYHCLGSMWSQRDKKGREGVCWSVRATVRQFNRLANAVTASCLWQRELRTQQRSRLLEKWISVAEVGCRPPFLIVYLIVCFCCHCLSVSDILVCRNAEPGKTSRPYTPSCQHYRATLSTDWGRRGRRPTSEDHLRRGV